MLSFTCRWVSIMVAVGVFLGLLSLAGNVHVAEFFGSMIIGVICGGLFYFIVCKSGKNKGA